MHKHTLAILFSPEHTLRQLGVTITLGSDAALTKMNGKDLPMADPLKYLDSIVRLVGGAGIDIQSRLNKARNIFSMVNNVWRSLQYSRHTKLKIYQSYVLPTRLYGSEYRNDCCRPSTPKVCEKYFASSGTQIISNKDLFMRCVIMRRRWR